jgi:hypothetical protein
MSGMQLSAAGQPPASWSYKLQERLDLIAAGVLRMGSWGSGGLGKLSGVKLSVSRSVGSMVHAEPTIYA